MAESDTKAPSSPPPPPSRLLLPSILAAALGVVLLAVRSVTERAYPTFHPPGLVVVTGTSTGIGHEIVRVLAKEGFHVLAGVRREEDKRKWEEEVGREEEAKDLFFRVKPIFLDVTDETSIEGSVKEAEAYLQGHPGLRFSGLVSNAGIGYHMPIEDMGMKEIRRLFDVNTFGAVAVTQRFIPLLRQHQGRIVFISSLAGRIVQPKEGAYAATKHALEAFADALRQELMPWDISVSLVEPGFVSTPLLHKILETEDLGNSTAAHEHYPKYYGAAYRKVFEQAISRAGSPREPALAVLSGLTARYPKTRYTVTAVFSAPTWLCMLVKSIAPDRLFDKIVTSVT